MLDRLAKFADKHNMFPEGSLILAAVSGGADSMCLLAVLLELSEKRGFTVAAAHFNHLLRGKESDRDALFIEGFCQDRKVPIYSDGGDVAAFARSERLGIEEAARRMRYDFFYKTAEKIGAKRIATAHTADDNAETVILNITRGAGLTGLSGIPPTRGIVIRPMLTVTREDVMLFLSQRHISFVEDSSNALDIYSRNMIRHRVIPVLREINPQLSAHISVMTSLIREDNAYINDIAESYARDHCCHNSLDASELLRLPRPVSSRVIRLVYGNNLSAGHVSAVLDLCASGDVSSEVALPSGTAFREYGRIVFSHETEAVGFAPVEIKADGKFEIPELGLSVTCRNNIGTEKINKSFTSFLFKYDSIYGKIVIRPRETADKINIYGRNGTKTLKKLFIEQRIPRRLRSLIPVITDDKGVLAVYGIGIDNRVVSKAGEETLEIIFRETAYEK